MKKLLISMALSLVLNLNSNNFSILLKSIMFPKCQPFKLKQTVYFSHVFYWIIVT